MRPARRGVAAMTKHDRGFRRLDDGTEVIGANRREVLLGAGGLAAVAAVGRASSDKQVPHGQRVHAVVAGLGTFEASSLEVSLATEVQLRRNVGPGSQPTTTSKAQFEQMLIRKFTDTVTPLIMQAVAAGTRFDTATFTVTSKRSTRVITYELFGVYLSFLSNSIDTAEDASTDDVRIAFERLKITVDTVPAGWDLVLNRRF
jgi:type VI protein secretion system component Hcp